MRRDHPHAAQQTTTTLASSVQGVTTPMATPMARCTPIPILWSLTAAFLSEEESGAASLRAGAWRYLVYFQVPALPLVVLAVPAPPLTGPVLEDHDHRLDDDGDCGDDRKDVLQPGGLLS